MDEFFRNLTASDYTSLYASIFGAFFGALCAYILSSISEAAKAKEARYESCLRLQLVLLTYLNFLENVRLQHLELFRNDPHRAFLMPIFYVESSPLDLNFDSLSFLLSTKDANLVQDVYLADRNYHHAIEALRTRNARLDIAFRDPENTIREMDAVTGKMSVEMKKTDIKIITDATNALYNTVDGAINRIEQLLPELKAVLRLHFKGKKFLDYKKDDPSK